MKPFATLLVVICCVVAFTFGCSQKPDKATPPGGVGKKAAKEKTVKPKAGEEKAGPSESGRDKPAIGGEGGEDEAPPAPPPVPESGTE